MSSAARRPATMATPQNAAARTPVRRAPASEARRSRLGPLRASFVATVFLSFLFSRFTLGAASSQKRERRAGGDREPIGNRSPPRRTSLDSRERLLKRRQGQVRLDVLADGLSG